ncbi:MAG: hypothetical protein EOM83_02440 [Clostridia bacterium]|nr:hypothetical protein [Clostridia bacterium]
MGNIKEIIKQLKNINLDYSYSYERILLFFEKNNIEIPTLTYDILKGKMLFRSRENFDELFFHKIDGIKNPAKKFVTKFNRANRPYQSCFYCSDKRETSYSEFMEDWLDKPFGSTFDITVGMWETIKDLKVHLIYDRKDFSQEYNLIKGVEWDDDLTLMNDFLVDIYKASSYNNKQIYILTSAISNVLLMRSELDGILFPCIPTNGIGLNLVLNSNICVENVLILKHVTRDTFLTTLNENRLKANHINIASIDGKIDFEKKTIIWK